MSVIQNSMIQIGMIFMEQASNSSNFILCLLEYFSIVSLYCTLYNSIKCRPYTKEAHVHVRVHYVIVHIHVVYVHVQCTIYDDVHLINKIKNLKPAPPIFTTPVILKNML